MSSGSNLSIEDNESVEEMNFDPRKIEPKKQVRHAGKTFSFPHDYQYPSKIADTITDKTPPLR